MGRALLNWDEWHPGLDTDDLTIAEVLATMPAAAQEDVPEVIQKYENPGSPDALPGAISLARHDCLHVILGRGLHVQDEAFVIGATMGADRTITAEVVERFVEISTTLYPKNWRFEPDHIASFRLGVGFAMDNLRGKDLHLIPFESEYWINRKVRDVRKALGIVKEEMRAYYRAEEILTPGTRATRRLDTCGRRPDGDLTAHG